MLTLKEIRNWVGKENLREPERVLKADHVISCERVVTSLRNVGLKVLKIEGSISSNGKIEFMKCSCPAGQGMMCKHVVGVLLYCMR